MHAKPLVLMLLVVVLGGTAIVRRSAPDPLSKASLGELLQSRLDPASPEVEGGRTLWQALLEHPALTRTADGATLRLGRVLADPCAARDSAERAGELLALEAEGPEGKLGKPLWRAVLEGPALEHGPEGRTLALYGCRHQADAAAAATLEDGYHARLSLADALSAHAGAEPGAARLTLLGRETPVKGGVNFDVKLVGGTQTVSVTFDGRPAPPLGASRALAFAPPNDARARAALCAALHERAAAEGLGKLEILGEEAPVENGIDVRIEVFGSRLALRVTHGVAARLAAHRELAQREPRAAKD